MSGFSRTPRLVKGAIVGVDPANPLASIVVFQYNPESVSRTLTPAGPTGGNGRADPLRLSGPPAESVTVKVRMHAADQLDRGDPVASTLGLYPQLSALEMLLYPKLSNVIANSVLMQAGVVEIVPPEMPFTLFIWGRSRVVPIRITSFRVEEQLFDPNLNPIQLDVDLSFQVLTYNDFPLSHLGFWTFLTHQAMKEVMAVIGSAGNLGAVASGDAKLL